MRRTLCRHFVGKVFRQLFGLLCDQGIRDFNRVLRQQGAEQLQLELVADFFVALGDQVFTDCRAHGVHSAFGNSEHGGEFFIELRQLRRRDFMYGNGKMDGFAR